MQANRILERHYMSAKRALQRSTLSDEAAYRATLRALDCAALHVGLDAMSRIQAKRRPQAGCVASYPPIDRRDAEAATHSLFHVLRRHEQALIDAEGRGRERLTLTMRADSVARHHMLAVLG